MIFRPSRCFGRAFGVINRFAVAHYEIAVLKTALPRELGDTTQRLRVPTFPASPDRQRRAPKTVARKRPVFQLAQPLAEPAVFCVSRHPVDFLVVGNHALFELGHFDEPRFARVI